MVCNHAMRYRLRTLLIVLVLGPAVLALVCWETKAGLERYREQQRLKAWAVFCVRTGWMISGDLPAGLPPAELE